MDETHDTYSTANKKGGYITQCWENTSSTRLCEPAVKNSRHTTGVYTTNATGVVLPLSTY